MTDRFQIQSPDGAVFELSDPAYFLDEYAPRGFVIVKDPPAGHSVPDLRELKAERKAKADAEAERQAAKEAAAAKEKADRDAKERADAKAEAEAKAAKDKK